MRASSIAGDGSLGLSPCRVAYLVRAGQAAGLGHLAVDDDAWRGHDAEAHNLGEFGDLLKLDLGAGIGRRPRDGVGGDLAVAAAGA
jgi:hypothetical protein